MPENKRFYWIDVMKLFAMFFVYTVHYSGMGRYGLYFFLLLVPCFFFCSGFCCYNHEKDSIMHFVKLRLQRVVWPYITFCAISLFLRILIMQMSLSEILDWLRRVAHGGRNMVPVAALWFLPCLFFLSIFYHILQKLIKNKLLLLGVCFAISVTVKFIREDPVAPWGIDMAGRFIIYYAIGDIAHYLFNKYPAKTWNNIAKTLLLCITSLCLFISYFGFYYGLGYIPSLMGITQPTFFMLSAEQFLYILTGMWSVAVLSMLLQNIPALWKIGSCTLYFCGFEQVIKTLLPLAFAAFGLTVSDIGGATMLMQAAITMVICYYVLILPTKNYLGWVVDFKQFAKIFKES